jgi:gamma-tubulin complex component 2
MSSTARAPYTDRRTTATKDPSSARPRAPSGRGDKPTEGQKTDGRPTISPSVSGNAHKRMASGSQRPGVDKSDQQSERRTERTNVTTREHIVIRTRSPEKQPVEDRRERERERAKQNSRAGAGSSAATRKEVLQGQFSLLSRYVGVV